MTIKEIRERAYMTQTQFAKEIGVHFNSVVAWEKGYSKPRLSHQKQIDLFCQKHNIRKDR